MESNYLLNNKNVLIVDQSKSSINFLKKILYNIGFIPKNIYFANNYIESKKHLKNRNFDFIFSEYKIGADKSCHDLISYSKSLKEIPIFIVLTSESSSDIVLSVFDSNPNSYITKPFNLQTIKKKIDRSIKERNIEKYINEKLIQKGVDSALISCENAIISNPDLFTFILKIKSKILLDNSRNEEAKLLYKTLFHNNSNNIQLILEYSKVLINEKKYSNAEQLLIEILEKSPRFMEIYDILDDIYIKVNNIDKRIKFLKKAIKINPLSRIRHEKICDIANNNNNTELLIFAHEIFLSNNHFIDYSIKLEFLFLKIKKYIKNKKISKIEKYREIIKNFKSKYWKSLNSNNKSYLFLIEFQLFLNDNHKNIREDFKILYNEYSKYISNNEKLINHIYDYLLKNNIIDIIEVLEENNNKSLCFY